MSRPLSDSQRRCVVEATIDPLIAFPRGFARTKMGPFFQLHTVNSLINNGCLRVIRDRRGRHYLKVSARAE